MTITITASADQVAVLPDGRIVIAKPGTDVIYKYEDGSGQELWPGAQHPADLVAVTEPCQTCRVEEPGHEWYLGYNRENCPDCRSGHPLFDLKVGCDFPHEGLGCVRLPSCDRGFVTHAGLYVPGKLLPVVAADLVAPVPSIVIEDDGSMWINDENGMTPIKLPPDAVPGWYAVIAERRKT